MANNKFISQKTHTRLQFHPLRTSCQLVCLTPMSPIVQSVVVTVGEVRYNPNRELNPTCILPDVRAIDPDRIFLSGNANKYLSLDELRWMVDGKPIASVWTADTDYEIDDSETDTRGMLRLKKNIPANEKHVLSFEGKFLDFRTNLAYSVASNEILVLTTDKGENVTACSVDKDNIVYDPLYDGLLLYDYKVARGIPVEGERSAYVNDKCYEQDVSVIFTSGTKKLDTLPEGVVMKLFQDGQEIFADSDHPEIEQLAYPLIKLDMRMLAQGNYEIRFMKENRVLARTSFSAHTEVTMPDRGKPMRGSDINVSQKLYTNSVLLDLADRMILYPEVYYLIKWFTIVRFKEYDPVRQIWIWKNREPKKWQQGQLLSVAVKDIGMGITANDSYFCLYFEAAPQDSAALLLADDNDTIFTDDDENDLIS